MTEISVSGLVKSFEIGNNILDGITFQVETGERVGLLGRNGAGKSTLFKILTGELDYDEGDVVIAKGRRLGLISQIPVYPVGFTVEDVLNTAFSRHQKLAEEMERLAAAMAEGDSSDVTLKQNLRASAATIQRPPSTRWPTAYPFPRRCALSSLTASPAEKRPG